MRKLIVIALMLILGGCAMPHTRSDFVTLARQHNFFYINGKYVADRPFPEVVRAIRKDWSKCYNTSSTSSIYAQNGMETSRITDTLHPSFVRVSNSLVKFTVQDTTKGAIVIERDAPKGGDFAVALDVKRLGRRKTELDWYSPVYGGWKDSWANTKKWADGKTESCAD